MEPASKMLTKCKKKFPSILDARKVIFKNNFCNKRYCKRNAQQTYLSKSVIYQSNWRQKFVQSVKRGFFLSLMILKLFAKNYLHKK